MTCPVCFSAKARVVTTRVNAKNQRIQRFECAVCQHRWTTRNGLIEQTIQAFVEIDWRVPATEGCRECVHYLRGFCSLGLPEAKEPGFVTECEARMVQGDLAVIQ
jgi:hypothetical protein